MTQSPPKGPFSSYHHVEGVGFQHMSSGGTDTQLITPSSVTGFYSTGDEEPLATLS